MTPRRLSRRPSGHARPGPGGGVNPPAGPAAPAPERWAGLPMGGGPARHPPLGLGLWNLGRWDAEGESRTRATVARGLELGIPWFDTAEVYGAGRSERILGDAFARLPADRARPFLSTKLSWEHLRAAQVRPSLLASLRRLGLASVDLYLVHAPDPHVPIRETMEALEALRREGRIGAIGVSNFTVEELEQARAALGATELVANQVRFNLFERDDADPVLAYCREHRIVVEAYTPTARGLLAGRFLTGRAPPHGDPRSGRGIFSSERFPEVQARARRIRELAAEAGVPMLSIALHALALRGAAPVLGASRPEQVEAALAAWAARPPPAVLERAERIARGDAD
jgi:myo-inositol catabolism protein IolS